MDEVHTDVVYFPTLETIDDYNCQYIAHGDDLITIDGQVMYDDIRKANRFKVFKRTEGISSTDIVGRLLRASLGKMIAEEKTNEEKREGYYSNLSLVNEVLNSEDSTGNVKFKMLNSTRRIIQFSNKNKTTSKDDVIVYTSGAFDVLHIVKYQINFGEGRAYGAQALTTLNFQNFFDFLQ